LNFDIFNNDREAVINRAVEQGIQHMVIPGVDLVTSRSAIELAQAYPGLIFAAIGCHPNEAETWDEQTLIELRHMANRSWVVAVGEIGLDYYRDHSPHAQQVIKLKKQLSMAAELNFPVILHNRNAMADLLPILSEWFEKLLKHPSGLELHPGILHSFEGSEKEALDLIEMNFLIGISGPVTFKNAVEKQKVISTLPIDRLITETDAPFLTPHPFRGQRNEPKNILYIAEKIALLHHQPLPDVAEQIIQNSTQVFSWGV
jgi:TatD DNase family protein